MKKTKIEYKVGQVIFFESGSGFGRLIGFKNGMNYFLGGYEERDYYNTIRWTHVGIITKVMKDTLEFCEMGPRGFVRRILNKEGLERID